MTRLWRLLTLAAGLSLTVGVRVATPQTVFVRGTPPGSAVELVVNSGRASPATSDSAGNARFDVGPLSTLNRTETSAHMFVDFCGSVRRVILVESGQQPAPPEANCDRKSVPDLFIVRPVTTLVVDLGGISPSVWIRQGPAPPEWVGQEAAGVHKTTWITAPTGLMLSGGLGAGRFGEATSQACGDAAQCATSGAGRTLSAGATFWFSRLLAAEVFYVRPPDATATGMGTATSGAGYQFNTVLQTRMVTIAGKVGRQFGPLRIYGLAGANHTSATSTTTQTVSSTPTSQGGTETFPLKTSGWGWLGGGGAEGWVTRWIGIYGEGGRAALRGPNVNGGEGSLDDHLTFVTIGVRVRIGR